jgi:hypothetical protein
VRDYNNNIVIGLYDNKLFGAVVRSGYRNVPLSNENINDNKWRHFAWIINPDGSWLLYCNGVLAKHLGVIGYPASIQRSINYLGKSPYATNAYLNGSIDDFRMYDYPVSSSLIDSAYHAASTGITLNTQYHEH